VVRFVPHGVTATLVLAESHVVVSTWPEHGTALIDVLLCTVDADPEAVWGAIAAVLAPSQVTRRLLVRGLEGPG
jgi:S-adenosylmethionine decarboxylase